MPIEHIPFLPLSFMLALVTVSVGSYLLTLFDKLFTKLITLILYLLFKLTTKDNE